MFAVVKTGGKQYKVEEGKKIRVEKIEGKIDKEIDLGQVLVIFDGQKLICGNPTIKHAKIKAKIIDQARGQKVMVIKYKSKKRYRRKKGHRQNFTTLEIKKISIGREVRDENEFKE